MQPCAVAATHSTRRQFCPVCLQCPAEHVCLSCADLLLPKRKVGVKARKGAGRRNVDKLAKQEQRMLKNRESAARSRLRRQQHTAQLGQENEELRAQVELLNQQVCWCAAGLR